MSKTISKKSNLHKTTKKFALSELAKRLRLWRYNLDLYAIRGVKSQYRKGMRIFWWYGFLISTASAFVNSYVTLYALALGASSLQIGTLASTARMLEMLAPIPGAQWATRRGRRKPVVVIAYGLARVALLGALLVPIFLKGQAAISVIIVFFALRAGLASLGTPAWTALAGAITPPERRGRYFSSRKMVMAFASMLFVPLAGQIIEWFAVPVGYQVVFTISIIISAIALFIYARIPETPTEVSTKKGEGVREFLNALTSNREFLLFALTVMVWNFAWQFGGPYFSVYQVNVLQTTPRVMGLLATASALVRVMSQFFWGRVVDRRGARWTRAVCTLMIPVLPFLWLPMTKPWHAIFVNVPSAFLWAGYQLSNFNLLLELPEARKQTQGIAAYTTLIGLANIAGPLAGGQVLDRLGYAWNFSISGFGRLIGALLFILALKPFGKKTVSTAETLSPPDADCQK
ncbi:MAG: MFS transporter [Anaerolineae bacterium]